MFVAWIVSALALALGAFLGGRALLDPHWAARMVRLQEDEQGGGFAEFRATYGGVFLGLHGAGLLLLYVYLRGGAPLAGVAATAASLVLAAGWAGAAFGRVLSMWRDRKDTPFNRISALVEALIALAIGAPWVLWSLGGGQ